MTDPLRTAYGYYRSACNKWKFHKRKNEAHRKLKLCQRPYKLHLGCGEVRFNDWINIDLNENLKDTDIIWDLAWGIPVEESSCGLIFSEHMLEHLSADAGLAFLRECHRALQPGGVVRIAMPSLDVLIEKVYLGNWREQDWLTWPDYQFIKTRAEMMNIFFRWWGHQWIYDREELHRRLREAGFTNLRDVEWGKSEVPDMQNRETRPDSLLVCEATK